MAASTQNTNPRTGLLAKKIGMMRVFADDGAHVPVTVLSLEGLTVVGHRTKEKDGYDAVRLGAGTPKVKNMNKADRGQFRQAKRRAALEGDGIPHRAAAADRR